MPKTADAVEREALLHESLAGTVQHQLRQVLDRHEAHVRALHGLADRGGIGRVVLAEPAARASASAAISIHKSSVSERDSAREQQGVMQSLLARSLSVRKTSR